MFDVVSGVGEERRQSGVNLVLCNPINALVAQAIAAHDHIFPQQNIILDNSANYCPDRSNENARVKQSLSAIFDTMANLNRMALENPNLCVGE